MTPAGDLTGPRTTVPTFGGQAGQCPYAKGLTALAGVVPPDPRKRGGHADGAPVSGPAAMGVLVG